MLPSFKDSAYEVIDVDMYVVWGFVWRVGLLNFT